MTEILDPLSDKHRCRLPVSLHTIGYAAGSMLLTLLVVLGFRAGCVGIGSQKTDDAGGEPGTATKAAATPPYSTPIRPIPEQFARDSHRPDVAEVKASGAIDMATFSAGRDLTYVDDARIYWESDNDTDDVECDHSIHRSLEEPFRRLHRLLLDRHPGAILEVQETFRPTGIHVRRSLHREGRAIDLTCDQIPLEELAKLCWAAGFDWVLYEHSKGTGPHIHASVKRTPLAERLVTNQQVATRESRADQN